MNLGCKYGLGLKLKCSETVLGIEFVWSMPRFRGRDTTRDRIQLRVEIRS